MKTILGAKVIQSTNYSVNLMLCLSFVKIFHMKKSIIVLVIVGLVFGIYWFKFRTVSTPNMAPVGPLATKAHSAAFNTSVDSFMSAYFTLTAALVEADSVTAKNAATKFLKATDSIAFNELRKDTAVLAETALLQLSDIKANTESLLQQTVLTEMRQDFRMISENVYPFLRTINYEGKTLYWQSCPMAFGEGHEANWISNTALIVNPYLGKKDPEYQSAMLHCGEILDSIKAK